MEKTVINIKIDPPLKHKASQMAARLGLPLGTVVNNYLRQFVRERRVIFEEGLTPNKATTKRLLAIEKDITQGKNLSPVFNSTEEFYRHLDSL